MDKDAHIFPKGISPKVNVLARLGFELVYYDVVVQYVSHYTKRIPPYFILMEGRNKNYVPGSKLASIP